LKESFSQAAKREIREKRAKRAEGFTISQNADSINPADELRERFLERGTVNDPGSAYHLEIACDDEKDAEDAASLMSSMGFHPGTTVRRGRSSVYLKDREEIADFLGCIGAVGAMMEMENSLILKDMRNAVNRRVNFETANIEKTVSAAVKDIEDIRYIESHGGLKQLPGSLREMAMLRTEHADLSLEALGELADPPIGKSGVNHRLRRIRNIADRLRG